MTMWSMFPLVPGTRRSWSTREAVERLGQLLLALGADRPCPRRLRLVGQREDDAAEAVAPALPDARLAASRRAARAPARGPARDAGIDLRRLGIAERWGTRRSGSCGSARS